MPVDEEKQYDIDDDETLDNLNTILIRLALISMSTFIAEGQKNIAEDGEFQSYFNHQIFKQINSVRGYDHINRIEYEDGKFINRIGSENEHINELTFSTIQKIRSRMKD